MQHGIDSFIVFRSLLSESVVLEELFVRQETDRATRSKKKLPPQVPERTWYRTRLLRPRLAWTIVGKWFNCFYCKNWIVTTISGQFWWAVHSVSWQSKYFSCLDRNVCMMSHIDQYWFLEQNHGWRSLGATRIPLDWVNVVFHTCQVIQGVTVIVNQSL